MTLLPACVTSAVSGFESAGFSERLAAARKHIAFTGHVRDEELLSLVGNAEALTPLYEGPALRPLEAITSRTPAVVTRAGSLPEVCGEAALYFDPLDVVTSLSIVRQATDTKLRWREDGSETRCSDVRNACDRRQRVARALS